MYANFSLLYSLIDEKLPETGVKMKIDFLTLAVNRGLLLWCYKYNNSWLNFIRAHSFNCWIHIARWYLDTGKNINNTFINANNFVISFHTCHLTLGNTSLCGHANTPALLWSLELFPFLLLKPVQRHIFVLGNCSS